MSDSLAASYAAAAAAVRRASSSFPYCFYLLKEPQRKSMRALYAFLRKTDDLADARAPSESRRRALAEWRDEFVCALQERPSREPILPAVVDTLRRHAIPAGHLMAVIDGVEQDLQPAPFGTRAELDAYCYRVASVVGVACVHVWGYRDPRALTEAETCGRAFQMTNILRDLGEDAARGRVYLPEDELAPHGYSRDDLLRRSADGRFLAVVEDQLQRTEQLYQAAVPLETLLSPEGRRVFGAMTNTYYRLLQAIRRHRHQLMATRVRVGRGAKLAIAARWSLGRTSLRQVISHPQERALSE